MSVINELIRTEANGTLSFGNYSLAAKSKVEDFEHEGDLYKVKTFKEITKLETEFERKMGKKVFLEAGVDKSLLGGFVCTIDKVCFDCSLRTRLVSLKEHIMAKEV